MLVQKWIDLNAPLRPEQTARLDELAKMRDEEIAYDEECPPQTPQQLKAFQRVHPRHLPRSAAKIG